MGTNYIIMYFVITFWISFIRIYWQAAFFDRVAKGIKIFQETTEWYDWISFTVFLCAWIIYNHYEIAKSFKNSGKQLCFILTCCRINKILNRDLKRHILIQNDLINMGMRLLN
eukprot:TRINITY_DN10611_c0_g1_i1.p1 TRINITY_DN10611_c0_g1~~TRINITY_DN10611_c0_g1_i1.p1  ORF type:complete len:113 (-),score=4.37 TRINITY_DN10611_c0_g1_i1:49-387(-)